MNNSIVGTVSARSQTTPHKRIMKRARRTYTTPTTRGAAARKKNTNNNTPDLDPTTTSTTTSPKDGNGKQQQQMQQSQQPQQRRKRRRVYNNIKKEEEQEEEEQYDRGDGYEDDDNGGGIESDSVDGSLVDYYQPQQHHQHQTKGGSKKQSIDQQQQSSGKSKETFKCPFCDHKSGRPNNLVIHINSKHFEESPPRTSSQDPAECIGESILYFLSIKREFEEKIMGFKTQATLCNNALKEVLSELTPEQKESIRKRAEKEQNKFLSDLLGPP